MYIYIFFILFKKFLELEEREPNMSAAVENGIENKVDVPVVKLNRITAYWDKVRYCLVHLSLFKIFRMKSSIFIVQPLSNIQSFGFFQNWNIQQF